MPYLTLTDGTQVHYRGKGQLTPEEQAKLVAIIEKTIATMDHEETERRASIARRAFAGDFPALAAHLADIHGYIWDSVWYPANGATLAEYIKWVQALDAATLAELCQEAGS